MKKFNTIIIAISALMLITSCSTTGQGAFTGAYVGTTVGGAIGALSGGYDGYHVGRLMGMAVGAGTGAAIGASNEQQRREEIRAYHQRVKAREYRRSASQRYRYSEPYNNDDTYHYSANAQNATRSNTYAQSTQQNQGFTIGTPQQGTTQNTTSQGFHFERVNNNTQATQTTKTRETQPVTIDDSGFDPNNSGDDRIEFE